MLVDTVYYYRGDNPEVQIHHRSRLNWDPRRAHSRCWTWGADHASTVVPEEDDDYTADQERRRRSTRHMHAGLRRQQRPWPLSSTAPETR